MPTLRLPVGASSVRADVRFSAAVAVAVLCTCDDQRGSQDQPFAHRHVSLLAGERLGRGGVLGAPRIAHRVDGCEEAAQAVVVALRPGPEVGSSHRVFPTPGWWTRHSVPPASHLQPSESRPMLSVGRFSA